MTSGIIFLASIGGLPNKSMAQISKALSMKWDLNLEQISVNQFSHEIIQTLVSSGGLVHFDGDIAMMTSSGSSWLEALGVWKVPVILMIEPFPSGTVSGLASSYVALCKQLSVPLLGLIQIGEPWIIKDRRLDGLPWCGCFPSILLKEELTSNDLSSLDQLVIKLKQQLKYLDQYY